MKRFVDGNNVWYGELKSRLQDGQCHVFKNCNLPNCCSKNVCRIGFEKENGTYSILVDYGITCSRKKGGISLYLYKQLLSQGKLSFLDFNDLKIFLKSLSFLYK